MNITYTYRVISVNKDSRCAEVLYESESLPTHRVSIRFPFKNESLQQVIEQHAPIYQWSLLLETLPIIEEGMTGSITYNDEVVPQKAPVTKVEVIG